MDLKLQAKEVFSGLTMDNFTSKTLKKLYKYTLMETLNDVLLRRIFVKFIHDIHSTETEFESINILHRYIICHKILSNQIKFENTETTQKLIKLCPNFKWQQKIEKLTLLGENDLNFTYIIEKLKWETVIDLICHDDYKHYLTAIKSKSKLILDILRDTYESYYF